MSSKTTGNEYVEGWSAPDAYDSLEFDVYWKRRFGTLWREARDESPTMTLMVKRQQTLREKYYGIDSGSANRP